MYFLNGQEAFGFQNKKEVNRWVNNINQLVTGSPGDFETPESKAIPRTEYIAETLKDTFDIFKGTFGLKSKTKNSVATEKVEKNVPLVEHRFQDICNSKTMPIVISIYRVHFLSH